MPERKRGKELATAILNATWSLLEEKGYAQLTMDAIAAQARTNKNTIYRRWPNKPLLVAAAIQNNGFTIEMTTPETGSLRNDLISLLNRFTTITDIISPTTCKQLISESLATTVDSAQTNVLYFAMDDQNWITQQMTVILDQATERGELPAKLFTKSQKSLPAILLIQRLVLTGTFTPEYVVELVDTILLPVFCGPALY